ncbi:ABC transporter permease [Loktanella fryxellensis]|nr:ABC transporter permease [Loktanella fryxellensis]
MPATPLDDLPRSGDTDTATPGARRHAPLPQTLKPPRFKSLRSITALTLREMESTYGRQPGGYIWAILKPMGMIVILSVAFSMIVHQPPLGVSFIFFYATGFLPFDIYMTMSSKISGALSYSRPMLSYPRVTWIDAVIARAVLNGLTQIIVFFIVIFGIMALYETRAQFDIGPVLVGLLMIMFIGIGVGMLNAVLIGLYPVWGIIWGILSRPLFLASAVLFVPEKMPPNITSILLWNPLVHGIGLVRKGLFPTYDAPYVSLVFGFGIGLGLCAAGLLFLRAHYKTVLQQ